MSLPRSACCVGAAPVLLRPIGLTLSLLGALLFAHASVGAGPPVATNIASFKANVPEPSSLAIFALTAAALACRRSVRENSESALAREF